MTSLEERLAAARRRGDPAETVDALLRLANQHVQGGRFAKARALISEAAEINRQRQEPQLQARCLHMIASLHRMDGSLDSARKQARQALDLARPGTPPAVSASAELGEIALHEGNGQEAARALEQALEHGLEAGLLPGHQAALHRRMAQAWSLCEDFGRAVRALRNARKLLDHVDDGPQARRVDVEMCTALYRQGEDQALVRELARAEEVAREAEDHHVLADLAILRGTRALDARRPQRARTLLRQARDHALRTPAPLVYVSAVTALSEVCERLGDRIGAYEALATGWVTLGDLAGPELARSTFRPKLEALRRRWGEPVFRATRSAYEARRKAEMREE